MKKLIAILLMTILLFTSCFLFPEDVDIEVDMVLVNGGTFAMGNIWTQDYNYELPRHDVKLDTFYIATKEVTCEEFIIFLNDINADTSGRVDGVKMIDMLSIDCPVAFEKEFVFKTSQCVDSIKCAINEVTWYGAVFFCNWLSDQKELEPVYTINGANVRADFTSNGYRLPTEAEWEYAARNRGRREYWSGTDIEIEVKDFAWNCTNCGNYIQPVGTKLSNGLGIYDMSGNVGEWCWDWYDWYDSGYQVNPKGPGSGRLKVLRGGTFGDGNDDCRTTSRSRIMPENSTCGSGFRVARNYDS